ncbi:MAG TPA: DUF4870 domain-containing protein [Iamia sp.]|nr:DUF4870 domain-containing protein [Iamia sp.]
MPGYGAPVPGYGPNPAHLGPYVPSPAERSSAMWAHLGALLTEVLTCGLLGFLPPLIIMNGTGSTSPYVRQQAGQALGLYLVLLIASVIYGIVAFVFTVITLGFGAFVVWILALPITAWWITFRILGAVKANNGEWYKIPANIPLGGL